MDLFTEPWTDSGCMEGTIATLRCIWPLFHNLINASIVLSGVAALIYIMLGGIRYVTSRGDAEAIESARKTITFAIIGLVFVLLSFTIFNFVLDTIGVQPESMTLPAPTPSS